MRMSCNGCRALRKGCSENCSIQPCLQWIKSPEAQGHATVFLAKFYGRAGLMNLINSGPDHLRPAVFRSLMYEACGRMVNPIYGSVGLLWSGSWPLVEAAVDAMLKGAPINSIPSETAAAGPVPHPTYDIRHVSKTGSADAELHKVNKTTHTQFKHTGKSGKVNPSPPSHTEIEPELTNDSSDPNPIEPMCCGGAQREASVDTVEAGSHVSQGGPEPAVECEDLCLDLSLGFGFQSVRREAGSEPASSSKSTGPCALGLGLQLSAREFSSSGSWEIRK